MGLLLQAVAGGDHASEHQHRAGEDAVADRALALDLPRRELLLVRQGGDLAVFLGALEAVCSNPILGDEKSQSEVTLAQTVDVVFEFGDGERGERPAGL